MKLTFTPPLTHEGVTCAEMTLREPTGGDVLKAERAFAAETGGQARRVRNAALIAAVAGVAVDMVHKMPASQFKAAASFLNDFVLPSEPAPVDVGGELVIAVSPRIEQMGRIVDQLDLREPTSGEVLEAQRKLKADTSEAMRAMQVHLVALVADMPRPVIEALPISTLNRASRYLTSFI